MVIFLYNLDIFVWIQQGCLANTIFPADVIKRLWCYLKLCLQHFLDTSTSCRMGLFHFRISVVRGLFEFRFSGSVNNMYNFEKFLHYNKNIFSILKIYFPIICILAEETSQLNSVSEQKTFTYDNI